MKFLPLTLAAVAAMFTSAVMATPPKSDKLDGSYTFEEYVRDFDKHYATTAERDHRRSVFESRLRSILEHNADPSHSYKQGINMFTDGTEPFKGLARSGGERGVVSIPPRDDLATYACAYPFSLVSTPSPDQGEIPHLEHAELYSVLSQGAKHYAKSIDWR